MRRFLSAVIVVSMMFALSACGGQSPAASSSPAAPAASSSSAAPAAPSSPATPAAPKLEAQVVIGDWGGVWNEMAKTEVYADFEKTYSGTKVVSDFPGSSGAILAKMEAQKASPQLDVALMTELMTIKAIRAGLVEEINETKVPELKDVVETARMDKYGPAVLLGEVGIAYNPKLVKNPPKTWADLAKPEYKGMIALPNIANTSAILFLCASAKNNGGSEKNIDPGFKFIEGMKDNVKTTYKGDPDVQALLEREEIAIAVWWNGPALSAKEKGLNIEYVRPADGAPAVRSFINVVKNAPHPQAAYKMVAQYVTTKAQQGVVDKVNYGPTNKNVKVPDAKKAFIATGDDLKKLVNFDWGTIADNSNAWTERWNKIFGN